MSFMQTTYLLHPAAGREKRIFDKGKSFQSGRVGSRGKSLSPLKTLVFVMVNSSSRLIVIVVLAVLLWDSARGRHLRYVPMNSQTILDMMKDRTDPRIQHWFSLKSLYLIPISSVYVPSIQKVV